MTTQPRFEIVPIANLAEHPDNPRQGDVGASAPPAGVVLDVFGSSGSTLVAADSLSLRARLVELDPAYCDVIRQRYADHADRPDLAP